MLPCHPKPELPGIVNNSVAPLSRPRTDQLTTGFKIDHVISPRHRASGMFNLTHRPSIKSPDPSRLTPVGDKLLRPGDSWTLDDGSRLEFLGTRQWVTVSLRHDPGEPIVLGGIVLLLVGLPFSLYGKRRRVWLRLRPDGTAEAGGLPRTDYPGFADEFGKLVERWK